MLWSQTTNRLLQWLRVCKPQNEAKCIYSYKLFQLSVVHLSFIGSFMARIDKINSSVSKDMKAD